MKKSFSILFLMFITLIISSCSSRERLLVLNWGEYINDEVVAKFEETYNCDVVMSLADSNELFYSKLKSGTTVYDIVVPSDYMVEKMKEADLLQEIDLSKLNNYDYDKFLPGVQGILDDLEKRNPGITSYFVPYFWGTWGIMYNKSNPDLLNVIDEYQDKSPWSLLFDRSILPENTQIGMYETPRYAYTASMFYNNLDINLESDNNLEVFKNTLENTYFDMWGTDTLKKSVSAGNLDLAFMWTGDFLDMLYTVLEDSTDVASLNFDILIPDNTIAFMDNLVIPKKARHTDLAYKFIDFLLEPNNAYLNANVVGYCTPIQETYDMITNYESDPTNPDDIWLTNFAYAVKKYYPILPNKGYKGTVLANVSREYLNKLTNIYNNAKV